MKTIEELQNEVKKFCEDRDWNQFHNPKDLAIGISTEANELLDIFRFKSINEIEHNFDYFLPKVEDEIADVLFFVLRFAQMSNIDLGQALVRKLSKNSEKYTIERSKGNNKKYTEY